MKQMRRTAIFVKRSTRWATSGESLTPTAYAILVAMVAAILLVAMLSTCLAHDGFDSVLRVGCWLS